MGLIQADRTGNLIYEDMPPDKLNQASSVSLLMKHSAMMSTSYPSVYLEANIRG